MIGFLHGQLLKATPERLLLDVQGVGYEVHVPLSTWYEIEKRRDEPIRLFIHTHLREDGIALFGFWTEREKLLFERLIAVSGIGPRLARVVLSGMAPDDLLGAIAAGDIGRLSTIPGVGKKTAERMVLELKDKMRELAAELPETAAAAPGADQDVVSALVNLGYKSSLAERAVGEVRRERHRGQQRRLLHVASAVERAAARQPESAVASVDSARIAVRIAPNRPTGSTLSQEEGPVGARAIPAWASPAGFGGLNVATKSKDLRRDRPGGSSHPGSPGGRLRRRACGGKTLPGGSLEGRLELADQRRVPGEGKPPGPGEPVGERRGSDRSERYGLHGRDSRSRAPAAVQRRWRVTG